MGCYHNKSLDWLLKTDEPAYVASIAFKKRKQTREEIEQRVRDFFILPEGVEDFEQVYGQTFEQLVEKGWNAEDQLFGNTEETFVPSIMGCSYVSESKLKEMLESHPYYEEENRKYHEATHPEEPFTETKYAFAEMKSSTSNALKEMYKKCGLGFPHSDKMIPKTELMVVVRDFVENVSDIDNVVAAYMSGSLMNGSEFCKDADVIVVRETCPEVFIAGGSDRCKILAAQQNKTKTSKGDTSVDMFCFSRGKFKTLIDENYRIVQNIEPLLIRE